MNNFDKLTIALLSMEPELRIQSIIQVAITEEKGLNTFEINFETLSILVPLIAHMDGAYNMRDYENGIIQKTFQDAARLKELTRKWFETYILGFSTGSKLLLLNQEKKEVKVRIDFEKLYLAGMLYAQTVIMYDMFAEFYKEQLQDL